MARASKLFFKFFSPRIVAKALVTLDKSTMVVVGSCWTAAAVMLILSVFAVHNSVVMKKEVAEAAAVEPVVPVSNSTNVSAREAQIIIDRLKHQYPDIKFETGPSQSIVVRTDDGAKFHQWISAVSFIDTMIPHLRWSLQDFCVGACNGQDLMKAVVTGQRVEFTLPHPKE